MNWVSDPRAGTLGADAHASVPATGRTACLSCALNYANDRELGQKEDNTHNTLIIEAACWDGELAPRLPLLSCCVDNGRPRR